jgi:hypothetical protein
MGVTSVQLVDLQVNQHEELVRGRRSSGGKISPKRIARNYL